MDRKTVSRIKTALSILKAKETVVINKNDDKYTIFSLDGRLVIEYFDLLHVDTQDANGFYTITVQYLKKYISNDFFLNLTVYAKFTNDNYGYDNILETIELNKLGFGENSAVIKYKDIHAVYTGEFNNERNICSYMYLNYRNKLIYATNGHLITRNKFNSNINTDIALYKDLCTLIEKLKTDVTIHYGKIFLDGHNSKFIMNKISVDFGELNITCFDGSLTVHGLETNTNMLYNYNIKTEQNTISVNRKELLSAVKELKKIHPYGHGKIIIKDNVLSLFDLKHFNTLGGRLKPLNAQKVKAVNSSDTEFTGYFHIDYLEKLIKNIDNETLKINAEIYNDNHARSYTIYNGDFTALLMGVAM